MNRKENNIPDKKRSRYENTEKKNSHMKFADKDEISGYLSQKKMDEERFNKWKQCECKVRKSINTSVWF